MFVKIAQTLIVILAQGIITVPHVMRVTSSMVWGMGPLAHLIVVYIPHQNIIFLQHHVEIALLTPMGALQVVIAQPVN